MTEFLNDAKERATILEPVDVADSIIYVLSTPPHVHVSYFSV